MYIAFSALLFSVKYITLPLLIWMLLVTRTHRARRYYEQRVRHLTVPQAQAAWDRNMQIVAGFLHGGKPKTQAQKAEHALIMATVLAEVIAVKSSKDPMSYLKSRRLHWRMARKLDIGTVEE
ncbi:MAG: hypothetical protein ACPG5U_01900 [Planktomarina sp.]